MMRRIEQRNLIFLLIVGLIGGFVIGSVLIYMSFIYNWGGMAANNGLIPSENFSNSVETWINFTAGIVQYSAYQLNITGEDLLKNFVKEKANCILDENYSVLCTKLPDI